MAVVEANGQWILMDGSGMTTHETLPAGTYMLRAGMMGINLVSAGEDFVIGENEEVFGGREQKIDMINKAYDASESSTGVLLSGGKGIGKTLFSRMLATKAIEKGMPVVLVDHKSGGANIIDIIGQLPDNTMVMFDEFEKVFDAEDQERLLGMFDGTSTKKRLFVITMNRVDKASTYLLDRPGRFLFHLRFEAPNEKEIAEYLNAKVGNISKEDLQTVFNLSKVIEVNYDILNALAKMMNLGFRVREVLKDLNIASSGGTKLKYKVMNTLINTNTNKVIGKWENNQYLALLDYLLDDRDMTIFGNELVFGIEADKLVQDENGLVYTDTRLSEEDLKSNLMRLDPENVYDDDKFIDPNAYTVHTEIVRATFAPRYDAGVNNEARTESPVEEAN